MVALLLTCFAYGCYLCLSVCLSVRPPALPVSLLARGVLAENLAEMIAVAGRLTVFERAVYPWRWGAERALVALA